jgi:DNA-binding IclR family transcriptional regulator
MNQVLARATLLLAHLGRHRDGRSLRALAAESGIPASTCVRLLRDLVALGWADQRGPRGIYLLGPRTASLAHERPYRQALVAAARPIVDGVARRLAAQVLVAVLRGQRRLVLLRSEAGAGGDPFCLVEERELYASATGRLLVAHLPWRARRALVDAIGLPDRGRWPGVLTWDDLNRESAELRRTGVEINRPAGDRNAVAVAIPDGAGGTAALAIGMPKRSWDEAAVLRAARLAARRIGQALERGARPARG